MSGYAPPDKPLSERSIAEPLDIGRTPVREAMRDLVRDGLLEVAPARGTYVRTFTAEEVRARARIFDQIAGNHR